MTKKLLFIGGVGRSGTSALTEIVGSHTQIVLGMERYNKLFRKQDFSINKSHFEKDRFLNIHPGDTFYNDFFKFSSHLNAEKKWDEAVYVGVKYPRITTVYDRIKEALGEFKLIYIYRDIYDVAESWNRKAVDGSKWPKQRDYKKAVQFWNRSLRVTRQIIRDKNDIVCIKYEDLYFSNKSIEPIFDWLDLDFDNEVIQVLDKKRKTAPVKKLKKGDLTAEQVEYIRGNARFNIYEEFNSEYNILA